MTTLREQLQRRTTWQVLAFYLGGSWVLLQVIDLFADNIGLPDWVFPASLGLLLVGLPIVLATMFIQRRLPARSRTKPMSGCSPGGTLRSVAEPRSCSSSASPAYTS